MDDQEEMVFECGAKIERPTEKSCVGAGELGGRFLCGTVLCCDKIGRQSKIGRAAAPRRECL